MGHLVWGKLLLLHPGSGLAQLHFPGKCPPGVGSGWSIPLPTLQEYRVEYAASSGVTFIDWFCCLGSKLRPALLRPHGL